MKQPRLCILVTAVAAVALASSCSKPGDGGAADAGATIRIGEFASLTGKEAAFGQASHKGTQLAIDELIAAGGLLGKQIELITEDNRSTPGESATIAKKLITRDKVVAMLGEVASGRSLEAAPIAQASKVPMISPSSTNPKVTETGDYIFRVCFTDPFQGRLLAQFARNTLKAQKVAIFADVAAPYSVGLAQFFREPFVAGGGQVVSEQKYTGGDKDFKAQLTAIKSTQPDAIMIPGYYTEVGLIVAQARQLGITVPMFGGDGWEAPELIQIAGAQALEGTFYSTHFSAENTDPQVQKFVAAFKAKYNGETPDGMAALGYDSVLVLADAIRRAGSTEGPKLRDALASTMGLPGVSGVTTLDEHRDATKPAVIITVKDGRFQYVETIAPEASRVMAELLQQIINGLALGAIYALIALGYTMVYGVLRFINFAHSDIFMVGAFSGYYLARYVPQASITAGVFVLLGSMAVCALLGVVIEKLAYRPLRGRSTLTALITAIGVSLLLQNLGQRIFGANPKSFPALFPVHYFQFDNGLVIASSQITVFVVTIVLLFALRHIVLNTRIGTAMRALSFNPVAAALVGVNNDRVISFTFALGSALAAAGGILYASNYPSIDPLMGTLPGLKAFVAAVLGGIGNIAGAAVGGLVLGLVETAIVGLGGSTYRDAVAFAVLILILLLRPNGLLGKRQAEKV